MRVETKCNDLNKLMNGWQAAHPTRKKCCLSRSLHLANPLGNGGHQSGTFTASVVAQECFGPPAARVLARVLLEELLEVRMQFVEGPRDRNRRVLQDNE